MARIRRGGRDGDLFNVGEGECFVAGETPMLGRDLAGAVGELPRRVGEDRSAAEPGTLFRE